MTKILVTGGAGFIGSHLVKHFVQEGHFVKVIDNLLSGHLKNLESVRDEIEFIQEDIRNESALIKALNGIETVFHQAAMSSVPKSIANPILSQEINVNGTLGLLCCCQKSSVRRVIFAASSSFYGDTETLPKVESMPERVKSPYAAGKFMGEIFMRLFYQIHGLETISLRYFNVFGPFQDPDSEYAAVVPAFIDALLNNKRPVIFGDGMQTRDFTFISNVVHANILAFKAEKLRGEVVNIGCGKRISLLNLLKQICKDMDLPFNPEFKEARQGDVKHSLASIEKAREILGYEPIADFSVGIPETIAWYRKAVLQK
ncbi:NAD-dependent epimerase/dehydratase family protein [Candidatus Riflebacteria bacterium]